MIRRLIAKIAVVCFAFSALASFVAKQNVDMGIVNKIAGSAKAYVQSEEGQQTLKALGQVASATISELKEILIADDVPDASSASGTEQADVSTK